MKLPLKPYNPPSDSNHTLIWRSSKPFVENSRGVLIHRPMVVSVHKIADRWPAHLAMKIYCNMTCTGDKNFTFLDAVPNNKVLCAHCERMAQLSGLPTAYEICGHHVHVGGVKAISTCHGELE